MTRPRPSTQLLVASALLALAACKPATSPSDTAASPAPAPVSAPASAPSAIARAAASLKPPVSPKDAVKASIDKFLGVRSYHATMHMDGGPRGAMTNEIDFVAPDRYRMTLEGLGTQTIIGDTMFMSVQGRSMKVPMPAGTLSRWRDPAKLAENEAGMTVQAQGTDSVDGTPAHKYLVHHSQPQPTDVTLWVGNDDLPLQMQVRSDMQGKAVATTIRYSRFNDPTLRVDPPQ
ncbi:MAG: hypothetical protein ABIO58_05735 [Luteimonas sp.]